ncbi:MULTISPECIES: hypothetical protein [unclassified Methylobacterium]|uniref:hypothetical protein n=1 Tax=unclassified Methylobacterium TaxID=2615210 RepID=UPI003702AE53
MASPAFATRAFMVVLSGLAYIVDPSRRLKRFKCRRPRTIRILGQGVTGVDGAILAERHDRAYIVAIAPPRNAWHAHPARRKLEPHPNVQR